MVRVREGVDLTRSTVGVKVEEEAREGDRLNLIESQGIVSGVRGMEVVGRGGLIEYECEERGGWNTREFTLMIRR